MKTQIKASVFLGLSIFLTAGFSALQAWDSWDGWGGGGCRWECCNDGCHLRAAQPCCEDCGFFFGAEFLYWTTFHINGDYAVDGLVVPGPVTGTTTVVPDGNYHHAKNEWNPGFRIQLGYIFGCDGWDTRVVWTRFHTSRNHDLGDEDDVSGVILPTLWPVNTTLADFAIAGTASGSNRFQYDVVDWLFERPSFVSCTSTLRPFFGLRALRLHHKLDVDYIGGTATTDLAAFGTSIGSSQWGSEFEGIGLVAGLGYELLICDCFTWYADFSGSLLAGRHKDHVRSFVTSVTGVVTDVVSVHEKEDSLLPGYHIGTGLAWETNLCNYCFVFNVGYEFNQWFNAPDFRRFVSNEHRGLSTSNQNGSLLIHGLNVGANIYF